MKTTCCSIICLTALAVNSALSQQPSAPAPGTSGQPDFAARLQAIVDKASGKPSPPEPTLTKFDLDFPGGTPRELVAAIQKAMGRPLNAIIPDELAAMKLPALKMNSVDAPQLFQALAAASRKSETVISGSSPFSSRTPTYQVYQTGFGFRQGSEGRPSDDTIWYFYADKPTLPPPVSSEKVCRFYSLAPYLDRGVSVDDITTAIETGWKMLGETSPPTIKFHKDTKLLIAVGEPSKLETIDAVLKALEPPKPPPAAVAPVAKPAEKPKTEK